MRLLFEGGFYLRAAFIRGRLLFEGGFYSRAAFIGDFTVCYEGHKQLFYGYKFHYIIGYNQF